MPRITTEADLQRANIMVAWSIADRMTPEHLTRLCDLTLKAWADERDLAEGVQDKPADDV